MPPAELPQPLRITVDGVSRPELDARLLQCELEDTLGRRARMAVVLRADDAAGWQPTLGRPIQLRQGERLWFEGRVHTIGCDLHEQGVSIMVEAQAARASRAAAVAPPRPLRAGAELLALSARTTRRGRAIEAQGTARALGWLEGLQAGAMVQVVGVAALAPQRWQLRSIDRRWSLEMGGRSALALQGLPD